MKSSELHGQTSRLLSQIATGPGANPSQRRQRLARSHNPPGAGARVSRKRRDKMARLEQDIVITLSTVGTVALDRPRILVHLLPLSSLLEMLPLCHRKSLVNESVPSRLRPYGSKHVRTRAHKSLETDDSESPRVATELGQRSRLTTDVRAARNCSISVIRSICLQLYEDMVR